MLRLLMPRPLRLLTPPRSNFSGGVSGASAPLFFASGYDNNHPIMKILLAEDDPMIGRSVASGLRHAGFTVDWVLDGTSALQALSSSEGYAALVLDLGLPKLDGVGLLHNIRNRNDTIPVLITTARDSVADRISGLNLGADDYLVKPFDLDELTARLRALLRRSQGRARNELRIGGLSLRPESHEVLLNNQPLTLSQREFALLEILMGQAGNTVSRETLEKRLYGWKDEVASNTIEVHLHNLRRKVGHDWIRNVRGVGYKIIDPQQLPP